MPVTGFLDTLKAQGVLAVQFGRQSVRMVTHLDFTDTMLDKTCQVLDAVKE
jgi:threonine aldolase